jgi:4-diphosphocytidyl-2-C-methyl-D-erythritol kinase
MLIYPNCKINLGLNVVEKRTDKYHNIETVFYPINWCDALEIIEDKSANTNFNFTSTGIKIEGELENNLIYKAYQLINTNKTLPPIKVHLHKVLPMGAGLGGGSADAAFFINTINTKFNLTISEQDRINIASNIGADCAFFINNTPVYATKKGNEFNSIKIDLSDYYILIVYPNTHCNTKLAYDSLKPKPANYNLKEIIENTAVNTWKDVLINDFENSIFAKYPEIQLLKQNMYNNGALYASMSGSGSAVYGIFKTEPTFNLNPNYLFYLQKPKATLLG